MHELGIARDLLDTAIAEARLQGANTITEIELAACGVYDEEIESLKTYMGILSRNTIAESARVSVNKVSNGKRGFAVESLAIE